MARDKETNITLRDGELLTLVEAAMSNGGVAEISIDERPSDEHEIGRWAAGILTVDDVKALHRHLSEILDYWEGSSVG